LILLPRDKIGSFTALTIGALIFLSTAFGDTIPNLRHIWLSREIVQVADSVAPCMKKQIISVGYHEPSLVFLAGTDTILAPDGAAAAKALKQNTCRVAVIDGHDKKPFLAAFDGVTQKPQAAAKVGGLNSGHGAEALLTLYRMPPK
ncbi:MAG: hypothetical protein KGI97_08425, partial [Alphaproteobacteria bacterium]|nr:hypothetical protein [Alphaproteobacteria bacterium]